MRNLIIALIIAMLTACGGTTGEPAASEASAESVGGDDAPTDGTADTVATRPDQAKLQTHIDEHLSLPSSRDEILAACADTAEFSEGEKLWVAQTLPEGQYETKQAVMAALDI